MRRDSATCLASMMQSQTFNAMSVAPIKVMPMTSGEIAAKVVTMPMYSGMPIGRFSHARSQKETQYRSCDDCSHFPHPVAVERKN